MLEINKRRADIDYGAADYGAVDYGRTEPEAASPAAMIEAVLGIVRRHIATIAFVGALTTALGVLYLLVTPPTFTAQATLLIDRGKVQFFPQQQLFLDAPIDAAAIE